MINLIYLIPLPFSIASCYMDIKSSKIKNYITYPLILIGMIVNIYLKGFEGFKFSAAAMLYAVFLILLLSSFIKLGGGDIKLIIGYASILGKENIQYLLIAFLILSILSNIARIIKEKGIKKFKGEVKLEIRYLGIYKYKFGRNIGAPLLLGAYLIVYFYINFI